MKGGKAGRPRKSATGAAKQAAARDKPTKGGAAKRPENAPPKKGSRKKSHGGLSSAGDE